MAGYPSKEKVINYYEEETIDCFITRDVDVNVTETNLESNLTELLRNKNIIQ